MTLNINIKYTNNQIRLTKIIKFLLSRNRINIIFKPGLFFINHQVFFKENQNIIGLILFLLYYAWHVFHFRIFIIFTWYPLAYP